MKNLNLSAAIAVLVMLLVAGGALAFQTNRVFSRGQADVEYTMGVVSGDASVSAGQWVSVKYSDTQGYDTTAVVCASGVENTGNIVGVAMDGGSGGAYIRIVTRGRITAYLNGMDSGSASGIVNGTPLASSIVPGSAGAASTYMTYAATTGMAGDTLTAMTAIAAANTRVIGYSMSAVASTDSGYYNRYAVYVTTR